MILELVSVSLGVVPEYQCAVKREAKKAQKDKEKPNSTTLSPTPTTKNNLNHMDIEMKVCSLRYRLAM